MKMCENCKNQEFKLVTKRHVVKTRHSERSEFVFENLEVEMCKVCGTFSIPESSEKMIEILRKQIRKEMEETVVVKKVEVEEVEEENFLKKAMRLFKSSN